MEKLLNPYDKEYMKMAMLKHEETFREQVYELHRLYQIQKLLMKNIAIRKHGQELGTWNFTRTEHDQDNNIIPRRPRQCRLDLERPAATEQILSGRSSSILEIEEDETELELTLGPTSQYCSRRRRKKTPLGSDSAAASFSSSSTGSSHIMINKKRPNSENHHQRINQTRDDHDDELIMGQKWSLGDNIPSSSRRNSSSDVVEDQEQLMIRQDRHANPPWLFQALSLNTS